MAIIAVAVDLRVVEQVVLIVQRLWISHVQKVSFTRRLLLELILCHQLDSHSEIYVAAFSSTAVHAECFSHEAAPYVVTYVDACVADAFSLSVAFTSLLRVELNLELDFATLIALVAIAALAVLEVGGPCHLPLSDVLSDVKHAVRFTASQVDGRVSSRFRRRHCFRRVLERTCLGIETEMLCDLLVLFNVLRHVTCIIHIERNIF